MAWQEVAVIGHPTRSAVEHCSRTIGAHVELELPDDSFRFAVGMFGMWFVELSITGSTPTATGVCFTGTISETVIPVQVIFSGEYLEKFTVDLDL